MKSKIRGEETETNRLSYCTYSVTGYCTQLILSYVYIFIPMPLLAAGLFTATAWIWNVAVYSLPPTSPMQFHHESL
jgi:hypothetical protein